MKKEKIYLDICCFNRPYDDQTQMRIQFESAAKLLIQSLIVEGHISFVWSYVLEFENAKNPFPEKRDTILAFKRYANEVVLPNQEIEEAAKILHGQGFKAFDSLHVACASFVGCDYILTVDDRMLNKQCDNIRITDPVIFINQWMKKGEAP
jgi:predicted nucleic acid-binding protein